MAGLFKVVLHSVNGCVSTSNEFINVFGYRSNLAVVNEEQNLADAFTTQIVPSIQNLCAVCQSFRRVEVYNVSDGVGYWDKPLSPFVAGVRTGENVRGFTAWGFRYNRVTAGKRHGYKRFGIISETDTFGEVPTAGMLTVLNATAVTLGSAITSGAIQTWFPEILERKPTGVYPWTSHPILGVQFTNITTQNSRKH
jgi:hypothetical protein